MPNQGKPAIAKYQGMDSFIFSYSLTESTGFIGYFILYFQKLMMKKNILTILFILSDSTKYNRIHSNYIKIFPGFINPFGSINCLISRIRW